VPGLELPKVESAAFQVLDVKVDRRRFNPGQGETVSILFRLTRPGKVILKVFDPEMILIRDLMLESRGGFEPNRMVWDGKDLEGNVVPDEVYFFTIEVSDYQGNFTFYDPTTVSGGEFLSPPANFDREKGRVIYELTKDARVRIRAGISSGGPLLKNILHGVPRSSGHHEEVWDGKDESGVIDVVSQKNHVLSVEAVSLPENSIFAHGNQDYDYFKYRHDIIRSRPKKVDRPLFGSKRVTLETPPGGFSNLNPEPRFYFELQRIVRKIEEGLSVVEGKIPIKIHLDQKIKRYVTEQRYEILFFVDFKFVTEKEEGYSPFTLLWDTKEVTNGDHLLTVNIVTLSGQVSSGTARVRVEN